MIRFKAGDPKGVPSGYAESSSPHDVTIPSCGIDDLELALFDMFDKELSFEVTVHKETPKKKVPVIFASGEKWSAIKNSKGIRDKTGSLILPLITIVRTSFDQNISSDTCGRGINQQTGEIVVKRKLSSLDRDYQNIVNRLYIKNQKNVAVDSTEVVAGGVSTEREVGSLSQDSDVLDGCLMVPDHLENMWEVISIPSPQFYSTAYDVTFWTQHVFQMDEMIEKLLSSLLVPGNYLRLDSSKGYWFLARMESESISPETNFSDHARAERSIMSKISLRAYGYLVASRAPGVPVSVKRVVSSPTVQFTTSQMQFTTSDYSGLDDPHLGADDPTLPYDAEKSGRRDQRHVVHDEFPRRDLSDKGDPARRVDSNGRPYSGRGKYVKRTIVDPKTGKLVERLVRLVSTNSQGEEVYAAVSDTSGLTVDVCSDFEK